MVPLPHDSRTSTHMPQISSLTDIVQSLSRQQQCLDGTWAVRIFSKLNEIQIYNVQDFLHTASSVNVRLKSVRLLAFHKIMLK